MESREGRGKEFLNETLKLIRKMCVLAAPQFTCLSALVFRIFPREYLLQQIHLYSLADLQQVSTQRGCFIFVVFLEKSLCRLWSLPSLG